ncbi:MAG TPA: amidohydrolase family protein [Solirubrobacterales bacterium]|nr:amidohydrolase family protein [Solirubrobacterales bacterium]
MAPRTLIRGACVVSIDPEIGDLACGDILIEDGAIAAVAPSIDVDEAGVEVVDGAERVVLPGFVDTHRHTWESAIKGVAVDWTHRHYFCGTRQVLGGLYRPEDIYAGNLIGAAESLDVGTTTLLDWSHNMNSPEHADAAVTALQDGGGRAILGYGGSNEQWLPITDTPLSRDAVRVRDQYFSADDGLVTMCMALRGPDLATMEACRHDWRLSRELGLRITVHVGNGEFTREGSIVALDREGLLGPDTTYVHCNTLSEEELRLLADSGGTASISPEVEMQMEMGFPATGRLLGVGVRPSLSVDVPNALGASMFGVMRAALQVQRVLDNGAAIATGNLLERLPVTARDVLEFATIEGARACGLDHLIGSITPGKRADLVLLRADDLALAPLNNPVGQIVLAGHPGLVDSVLVDGRFVKRDGRLTDLDPGRVRQLASDSRDFLFATAGVDPAGWIPDVYDARDEAAAI